MVNFRTIVGVLVIASSSVVSAAWAGTPDGKAGGSQLSVLASRNSAFVTIELQHHRKIGAVVLEVRDEQGRTFYREEGKALQDELVRRLDKGMLPRGQYSLVITTKDVTLTERFTVE